jgi:3-hydroxyisobutyrate dehydrogenase-like beta-hydroxyacid dehydrogenase
MARHQLEAGHQVTVASRSPGPVERAVSLGAADGGSPAGVAEASEVVILCVPSSPQVVEVVEAMLPSLRAGQVVVDCSTIDPEVARAQHERVTAAGAGFLDAPLSGGTAGAGGNAHAHVSGEGDGSNGPTRPRSLYGRIVHRWSGDGPVVKLCNI